MKTLKYFYEGSITMIPKTDKDGISKVYMSTLWTWMKNPK